MGDPSFSHSLWGVLRLWWYLWWGWGMRLYDLWGRQGLPLRNPLYTAR